MARGSLEEEELLERAVEVREEAEEGLGVGWCAEEDDWDWDGGFEGVEVDEEEEGARLLGAMILRRRGNGVDVRLVLDGREVRSQLGWECCRRCGTYRSSTSRLRQWPLRLSVAACDQLCLHKHTSLLSVGSQHDVSPLMSSSFSYSFP